jgi:hypothetical protein
MGELLATELDAASNSAVDVRIPTLRLKMANHGEASAGVIDGNEARHDYPGPATISSAESSCVIFGTTLLGRNALS